MPLTAAERMSFAVRCPRCGKTTEKRVAWLATKSRMRCSTRYCRALIALDVPMHRMVIDKLVAQALEIDALLITLERHS
jgi:hypothetical protein